VEAVVGASVRDRRTAVRHADLDEHGIVSIRVRPGYRAMLNNISSSGALVETEHRLLPGTSVELFLERHRYRATVRGRVVRCSVARVHHGSICYRGAIAFDQHLPWFVNPERVDATAQVV
jgi:hypothetical protein